jgi:hypothetical protein
MSKRLGTSTARCLDGTYRWELHVPKGKQQDYMRGFAKTEADADAAWKRLVHDLSRKIQIRTQPEIRAF